MSTVNEEEINEVNDNLMKEENENENVVVDEITTEQETEPMDAMVVEEHEVVLEEQKDTTAEETAMVEENDNVNEESAMVEENEQEQVPEEHEEVPEEGDHEDVQVEEVHEEEHEEVQGVEEEHEEEIDNYIDEPAQPQEDVQDMMNVDQPAENEDIVETVEEVKEEPMSSKKNSTSKINSRKSSHASLGNKPSSKQASNNNLNNNNNNNNNEGMSMIDKAFTEPASGQNEMRIYNGPIYCIEQVKIPPELPDIMKNYAKHIIRTQPDDVIVESYEYFKKLNKLRNSSLDDDDYEDKKNMAYNKGSDILENSNFSINSEKNESSTGKATIQLSPLELESFYERLLDYSDGNDTIPVADVRTMAEDANISQSNVNEAIVVGSWDNDVEWLKFWALIVAGSFSNLMSTLKVILDIIGDENLIPLKKITTIIEFLLQSDPSANEEVVNGVISQLKERDDEIIEKEELMEIISVLNK